MINHSNKPVSPFATGHYLSLDCLKLVNIDKNKLKEMLGKGKDNKEIDAADIIFGHDSNPKKIPGFLVPREVYTKNDKELVKLFLYLFSNKTSNSLSTVELADAKNINQYLMILDANNPKFNVQKSHISETHKRLQDLGINTTIINLYLGDMTLNSELSAKIIKVMSSPLYPINTIDDLVKTTELIDTLNEGFNSKDEKTLYQLYEDCEKQWDKIEKANKNEFTKNTGLFFKEIKIENLIIKNLYK